MDETEKLIIPNSPYSDHIPNWINDDDLIICSICDSKKYNHKPVDPKLVAENP